MNATEISRAEGGIKTGAHQLPSLKSIRRMGNIRKAVREVNRRPVGCHGIHQAFPDPFWDTVVGTKSGRKLSSHSSGFWCWRTRREKTAPARPGFLSAGRAERSQRSERKKESGSQLREASR